MNFYLFDVDHGQAAALRLPNGQWCIFDAGRTSGFSPVQHVRRISGAGQNFRFYKGTISHWHFDHLADYAEMFAALPAFMRTVSVDREFLGDVEESSSEDSWPKVRTFGQQYTNSYTATGTADYGGVSISELSLDPAIARSVSGTANSAVNNASIITRIEWMGYAILICGDMEAEAWDYVLNTGPLLTRSLWRQHVAGVNVLVAPHHGHNSAYSSALLQVANPNVVLVSVTSGDEHVNSGYSGIDGISIGGTEYKCITTRQKGTIKIEVAAPTTLLAEPSSFWTFDADGRRAAEQQRRTAAFSALFGEFPPARPNPSSNPFIR